MYFFILLFTAQIILGNTSEFERLKRLWEENVRKSNEWVRPVDSSEFKGFSNYTKDYGEYDFVIVGAGSSGAVIANRLTEIANWKVLLIEAGDDETEFSKIPQAFSNVLFSEKNWGYLTIPQTNACFINPTRQCDFSRGKSLGGSSSINAMMYVRGNSKDFDYWDSEFWTFKKVLPYYLKLENASSIKVDSKYRGTSGPMIITNPIPLPAEAKLILDAHRELGDDVIDINGASQLGITVVQSTVNHGKRWSTNSAYLPPAVKQRENLTIFTKTLATKIVTSNNRVEEVLFLRNGTLGRVRIKRELILSGGSVNSPQLLLLSGIGPAHQLAKHDIPIVADLPVGRNLEDHLIITLSIQTNLTIKSETFDKGLMDYLNSIGILTYTAADEVRLVNVNNPNKSGYPDTEIIITAKRPTNDWRCKITNCSYLENDSSNQRLTLLITQVLLHAKSRGEVTLKTADPTDYPNIDPKYLTHDYDIETIYKGIFEIERLLTTKNFRKVNAKLVKPNIEKCNGWNDDREFWYCVIRHTATGIWHPVATCKLGKDPKTSVVNEKLMVHGFHNLRVADASVVPVCPSGHTNAISIMIGERASDIIKISYTMYN